MRSHPPLSRASGTARRFGALALAVAAASGCSVLGFDIGDGVTDDDLECYEQVVALQADNERLTADLERAQRRLDAVQKEEYPRFIAAFELYVAKDWGATVDAFASFLREFPESPLADVARRLLTVSKLNEAERQLLCTENWRILKAELESLSAPEREGRVGRFLRECPDRETAVEALLEQLKVADAIRAQYTGEGTGGATRRGAAVGLEGEAEPAEAKDVLDVDRVKRPELDQVTAPGQ